MWRPPEVGAFQLVEFVGGTDGRRGGANPVGVAPAFTAVGTQRVAVLGVVVIMLIRLLLCCGMIDGLVRIRGLGTTTRQKQRRCNGEHGDKRRNQLDSTREHNRTTVEERCSHRLQSANRGGRGFISLGGSMAQMLRVAI